MFFMKKGKFYAVSTGAGSTELLTLKAIRILRGCEIIFYPESGKNTIALDSIFHDTGIDFHQKTLVPCHFSMSGNPEKTILEYEHIASKCEEYMNIGKDVAMLSIGDVTLYSTAARTASLIKKHGFDIEFSAGVNSFSQAACSASLSLCETDEKLTVIPGDSYYTNGKIKAALTDEGTKILMKMGRHLKEIISILDELDLIQNATLVQKASLPEEKIFFGKELLHMSEKDFESAYLSIIILTDRTD